MDIYVNKKPENCSMCSLCKYKYENVKPDLYKCMVDGGARFINDEVECPLKLIRDYKKHDFNYDKNNDESILGLAFVKYIFGNQNEDTKFNKLIKEVIEEVKYTLFAELIREKEK